MAAKEFLNQVYPEWIYIFTLNEQDMFSELMELYAQQVAKEAAADAWDAAMRYINDDSDFPMGEGKKKYPSKTEYINQKFPTNPNK